MNTTFDGYISNPGGQKGGAVWSHREVYRDLYTKKLDKILVRETGKVKYFLYYTSNNRYFIHFKIPSEVVPNFYYDVVIEFFPDNKFTGNSNNLKKYNIKFFSNDPAFVFTFAYSFLKNQLFIKELIPRMSKEAVKKAAKITNPKNEVGYVKSIYFAYLLMDKYNLWNASIYNQYGKPFKQRYILSQVEHSDKKIKDRQEKGEAIKKKLADEKRKERIESKKNKDTSLNSTQSKVVSPVKKSNKSKRITTVKNVKVTGSNINFKRF